MSVGKIVIARKAGRCWNSHGGWISPGDRIRVLTVFPGHDVLGGYCVDDKPFRLRECTTCTDRYQPATATAEPTSTETETKRNA